MSEKANELSEIAANPTPIMLSDMIDADKLAEIIRVAMESRKHQPIFLGGENHIHIINPLTEVLQQIRAIAHNAYHTGRDWTLTEREGALEDALDEIITLCDEQGGKP